MIYEGKHDPIIDIELFNRVQKMFNQSKARTHDVEFPYTGLIKCGYCGRQLTAELKKVNISVTTARADGAGIAKEIT